MGVLALVGTAKGLFVLRGNEERRHWRAEGPLLGGWGVYHATADARDGTLYAATNHRVYGSTVQRSDGRRQDVAALAEDRPAGGVRPDPGGRVARRAGPA